MTHRNPTPSRPDVPETYGIAAELGDDPIPWSRIDEKLAAARNYWISSTRPDGRPHAMPVWGIWLDGTLVFSTGRASRKGRNIAANPALSVHLESGDDVVVIEGVAAEERDAALLARYVDAYGAKYAFRPDPSNPGEVTYALRPNVAFAWLESDFPASATRWTFK